MWSTFEGIVIQRTARGVLFQSHFWDAPLWFPSSQMEIEPDGDLWVVARVKDWLITKKGMLEFTYYTEDAIKAFAGT